MKTENRHHDFAGRRATMRRLARVGATALVTSLSPALADAPIRSVTLSSAGVGEFVRAVPASETEVEIRASMDEVDDLLKSLVVLGDDLASAAIRLEGPGALSDTFESLPFAPEDLSSLETLLARLPGAEVSIRIGPDGALGTTLEGRVTGVSRPPMCPEGSACSAILSILDADGVLRQVELASNVSVRLEGRANEDVARALTALSGALGDRGRTLRLTVERASGADADAFVSYVLSVPVWKTAYRAVVDADGGVRMQAWAVVENASSEDWDDVSLTLAAGSPQTLRADLFSRLEQKRDTVALDVAPPSPMAARALQMFGMNAPGAAEIASADGSELMQFSASPPIGNVAGVDPGTETSESDVGARFTFPDPIDLRAGEMVSLPFLDGALDARAVSRWIGGRRTGVAEPELVLDVSNDLDVRLPAGIATLYEEGTGFLGDASVPTLAPGERRAVGYGIDRKASVEEARESNLRELSLVVNHGHVVLEDQDVRTTTYRLRAPADRGRAFVLDHPTTPGYELVVDEGPAISEELLVDRSFRAARFAVEARPGEEIVLRLRETRPMRSSIMINDAAVERFAFMTNRRMSDRDRGFITRAIALSGALRDADERLERLDEERQRLESEQHRMRQTQAVMDRGSRAHQAIMERIVETEERLVSSLDERDRAQAARDDARTVLRAHLATR